MTLSPRLRGGNMDKRYARPWKYTQGDDHNPNNGYVRTASGELIVLRATMDSQGEMAMRLIAASPDLLDRLRDLVGYLSRDADCTATWEDYKYAMKQVEKAKKLIAKVEGE
jgi:hypothetical protein